MTHRLLPAAALAAFAVYGPPPAAAQPGFAPIPLAPARPSSGPEGASFKAPPRPAGPVTPPGAGTTPPGLPPRGVSPWAAEGDGLDEVNAKRAARGLPPFARDDGLTRAAYDCARFRAARLMFGHTANDFAFVPPGCHAESAGCAAYPYAADGVTYGWMSCDTYDPYRYAGAAWVTGVDGRRFMHLFVR